MQVAVLFTVRLLWGNAIELLSCQSPVLLLLDWLLGLYISTLKPQPLGNQPKGSASNTSTQWHSSHGDALWRERKDSAGQRNKHLIQWCCLHVPLTCGFHTDSDVVPVVFPTGIVMLALPCKSHYLADMGTGHLPRAEFSSGTTCPTCH